MVDKKPLSRSRATRWSGALQACMWPPLRTCPSAIATALRAAVAAETASPANATGVPSCAN